MEDRRVRFKLFSSSALRNNADRAVDVTPLLYSKIFVGDRRWNLRRWNLRRFSGSGLFGINSTLGYFLMLAIMSFNVNMFVSIVAGLVVGYLLFRSGDDEQVVVVDNPCACVCSESADESIKWEFISTIIPNRIICVNFYQPNPQQQGLFIGSTLINQSPVDSLPLRLSIHRSFHPG
ncbi:hypothetical protein L6452_35659 [Arctium lappa]|uniref:Uncharacterized protein n=1 Tax=Arctium lappa TaxID=4217 RepID=A0ACB8Y7V6_ARCLA|nr:hypothetical protein L6452_35659 [Arctium lappa]